MRIVVIGGLRSELGRDRIGARLFALCAPILGVSSMVNYRSRDARRPRSIS